MLERSYKVVKEYVTRVPKLMQGARKGISEDFWILFQSNVLKCVKQKALDYQGNQ